MMSLTGVRFLIEFSSILVLAFLCIMHEFTDVTLAKQFNIDHAANKANFVDDVESTSLHFSADDKPLVTFTPESLDFGHQPISMPIVETVHVHNGQDDVNIQMISISGNTEHFHCSFFKEKIVPARSNTSFQVVFLARQEGLVNNTLYIHSSVGSFHFRVSAFGDASPFRVRPLIGARVPLNSSFASLIYIYNPFSTPLQLTEMYTSGGGLHLELPDDGPEAPSKLWKVPPYETRPVMKAHFVARIASNHTSYIRIRTNATDVQIMLPVEVEVSNSPGLYSPLDALDFGVLRSRHDPPKILPIKVINAAMKTIYVQNIVVTPLSEGLTVDFDGPIKLSPRTSSPYHVANLILNPRQFLCSGLCSGKVLIKSKNNQYKLSIPFSVRIIRGELYFNTSLSHFFINQKHSNSEYRILSVENRFETSMIVHDIILPDEAKPYFKLTTQPPNVLPVLLPRKKTLALLKLKFTPSPQLSHFSTTFRLQTNLSYFDLPLYAYRGRLDLFIPNSSDQTKLDLSLVGLNEQKSSTFVVANHNPIAIRLIYWHSNLTGTTVEFVGTSHGNITSINQRIEPSHLSRSEATMLQPNHYAVFRVHINRFSKEGAYNGLISITTPFETLNLPLSFNVLRGSLISNKVILPKTFPGRIVSSVLTVKSNYTSQIKLKGAFIEPKDERFQIKLNDFTIKPGEDNQIQIWFDASSFCLQRICYSALDIEKEVGHLWLLGSGLYADTAYIDKELYKLLRNQWLLLSESDRNPAVNIRLQVDGFGSFITEAQGQLYWPRLSNKLSIRFPSIRIGRTITKELMVENPADRPILIQAINVVDYPNSEVLLQLMSSGIFHQQWSRSDLDSIDTAVRNGKNTSAFMLVNSSSPTNSNSNRINEWLGVAPNANSYTMFLPPGARQRLAIAFHPLDEKNFTSLLILRNNLTIIEVVMLRGEGGRGLLKIGETLPNSANSKLLFEFPERNLERKCRNIPKAEPGKAVHMINNLVIREKFKATNIGRMGLQIRSFLIDGMPCEGYGFHINHCEPIFLMPNQTFEIEMVYSPDFTQPIVSHDLIILVDDDHAFSQKFKMIANVPQKLLRTCLFVLPRPHWENFIYYLLVIMAMFVLFLSIVVAVSDAHRITSALYSLSNGNFKPQIELDSKELLNSESSKTATSVHENGNIPGGGKQHVLPSQTNFTKVRNRRGKNNGNLANGNGHVNQNHRNVNQRQSNATNNHTASANVSKSQRTTTKNESQEKSNTQNQIQENLLNSSSASEVVDSNSWSNVMRKKLLRQDSSSSEHSQPSSDNSSSSSCRAADKKTDHHNRVEQKKLNNQDSTNEILPQIPSRSKTNNKTPPITTESTTKTKLKEHPSKKTETKISSLKKAAKNAKQGKQVVVDKTDKTFEKFPFVDASKSSCESLNFNGKPEFELTTKVRSATLPLLNEAKNNSLNEGNSISHSNIVPSNIPKEFESSNSSQTNIKINKSPIKTTSNGIERNELLTYRSNNNQRYEPSRKNHNSVMNDANFSHHPNHINRGKDIWDSPYTNFDSEHAMNLYVKQTEEFAAIDDKPMFGRSSLNQRKVGLPPERNLVNSVTKLGDDKWEIGEWNNELAKVHTNKLRGFQSQAKFNRGFFPNDLNAQRTRVNRMTNNTVALNSDPFENDTNDVNVRNYRGGSFSGPQRRSPQLSIGQSLVDNSVINFTPNNSSTFSPVIGRPTPSSSSHNANNMKQSSRLSNFPNNNRTTFNDFGPKQSVDSNFSLKTDFLDFLQPSLTSYQPIDTNNQPTILPENKTNLNLPFFSKNTWSQQPSLDNLSSTTSSFLPSPDAMSKSTSSPLDFNFASNESLWTPAWDYASTNDASSNSSGKQTSHLPKLAPPGFPANDKVNSRTSKWPSLNASTKNTLTLNATTTNGGDGKFSLNKSPTYANNRVWSPFDPYRNSSPTDLIGPTQSCNSENSFFEMFGRTPWSPLGSSLDGTASSSNTASSTSTSTQPLEAFERFAANPSPSSSSSSTNHSSCS